jgi:hypothetical protein
LIHYIVDTARFDCGYSVTNVTCQSLKGNWMRMILAVLALCAFVPAARAAGPDCRAIESTSGRLACYDAAFPPKMVKPVAVEKDTVRTEYKDPFLAEEARTAAKLKTICRGC